MNTLLFEREQEDRDSAEKRSLETAVSMRLSRAGVAETMACSGGGGGGNVVQLQELVRRSLSDSVGPLQQLLAQEMQQTDGDERRGQQRWSELRGLLPQRGIDGGMVGVCGVVLEQREERRLPVQTPAWSGLAGDGRQVMQGNAVSAGIQHQQQQMRKQQGGGNGVIAKVAGSGAEVMRKRQMYLLSMDSAADEVELLSTSLENMGSGMIAAYRGSD
jgi:hypothetical protein